MSKSDAIALARKKWGAFGMASFEEGEYLVGVDEVMRQVLPGQQPATVAADHVSTWPMGRSRHSWEQSFEDAAGWVRRHGPPR